MAMVHSQSEEPPAWLLERGLREFYEYTVKDANWMCVVCDKEASLSHLDGEPHRRKVWHHCERFNLDVLSAHRGIRQGPFNVNTDWYGMPTLPWGLPTHPVVPNVAPPPPRVPPSPLVSPAPQGLASQPGSQGPAVSTGSASSAQAPQMPSQAQIPQVSVDTTVLAQRVTFLEHYVAELDAKVAALAAELHNAIR